jgi:hypothetical protein
MEVTIKVPDKLAAEARARGVSIEVYVQEILARQALGAAGEERLQSVRAAIDRGLGSSCRRRFHLRFFSILTRREEG